MTLFIIENGLLCFFTFFFAFSWIMKSGGTDDTGIYDKDRVLGDMLNKSVGKNQIVRSFCACRA